MIPDPDRELAGLFSRSEEILQDHCKLYATSKAELKDLIQRCFINQTLTLTRWIMTYKETDACHRGQRHFDLG